KEQPGPASAPPDRSEVLLRDAGYGAGRRRDGLAVGRDRVLLRGVWGYLLGRSHAELERHRCAIDTQLLSLSDLSTTLSASSRYLPLVTVSGLFVKHANYRPAEWPESRNSSKRCNTTLLEEAKAEEG
ncbi:hypothetical protein EJB05_06543, partial [Eragrostis curvula]